MIYTVGLAPACAVTMADIDNKSLFRDFRRLVTHNSQLDVTHLSENCHHVDVYAYGKTTAVAQDVILDLPNAQSGFLHSEPMPLTM
jgi:hypothetical protein